jgi:hypothetical protein
MNVAECDSAIWGRCMHRAPAGVPAASESDVRVDPREGGGDCSLAGIAGSSNLSRPAHSADDHLPLVLHITDDDDDERVKNSVW